MGRLTRCSLGCGQVLGCVNLNDFLPLSVGGALSSLWRPPCLLDHSLDFVGRHELALTQALANIRGDGELREGRAVDAHAIEHSVRRS